MSATSVEYAPWGAPTSMWHFDAWAFAESNCNTAPRRAARSHQSQPKPYIQCSSSALLLRLWPLFPFHALGAVTREEIGCYDPWRVRVLERAHEQQTTRERIIAHNLNF